MHLVFLLKMREPYNMHVDPIRVVRAQRSTTQISSIMDGADMFEFEQICVVNRRIRTTRIGSVCMLSLKGWLSSSLAFWWLFFSFKSKERISLQPNKIKPNTTYQKTLKNWRKKKQRKIEKRNRKYRDRKSPCRWWKSGSEDPRSSSPLPRSWVPSRPYVEERRSNTIGSRWKLWGK